LEKNDIKSPPPVPTGRQAFLKGERED